MKNILCFCAVTALISCAPQVVTKVPQAIGGSKADGTIRLAYDLSANESATVDWTAAEGNALRRCKAWGYNRVDAFAGERRQCTERGAGLLINGALPGSCARETVTKDYQCLD